MDNKFRTLVKDIKTQMDKDVQFFHDHGIDPSTKYSKIPMYYPDKNSLIILRGPSKNSPYFTTGKVSPKDEVIIQLVKEERVPEDPTGEHAGNYYDKQYGEKIQLPVDEYIEKIYNNPRNEETKVFLHLNDLDTPEEQQQATNTYNIRRKNDIDHKNYEFNQWIQRHGDEFDLDDLTTEDQKTLALKNLYAEFQKGKKIQDLAKSNIIWKVKYQRLFKLIDEKLKKVESKEKRAELKKDLAYNQHVWYKEGINNPRVLLKKIMEWCKKIPVTESTLTEFYPKRTSDAKPIKNLIEVKDILNDLFGLDSNRFITVPVIKNAVYSQDKSGNERLEHPEQQLKVMSFPNGDEIRRIQELLHKDNKTQEEVNELGHLYKYAQVRVQDMASPNKESFVMNLSELEDLIKQPQNQGNELDTVDFRLQSGNEYKTLNPGMGDYIDLPEDVVKQMLKTVNEENWEYEDLDLIQYYEDAKRTGIPNPLLTNALNSYNKPQNAFVIRCYSTKDKGLHFKGFVPVSDHINSRPAMTGKDHYKELMK